MNGLLARMHDHDDNTEGKWLWSGKADRRRIVVSWLWFQFMLGVDIGALDRKGSYGVTLSLGPFAVSYVRDKS